MKTIKIVLFVIIISLMFIVGCSQKEHTENTQKQTISISAAASLTDVMREVADTYEKKHTQTQLIFNYAGSGTLARQIEQGAPVDVFISANENWMQQMVDQGFVAEPDVQEITGNKLVMITKQDDDTDIKSIDDIDPKMSQQIAIGNPGSVPAGEYTEAVLKQAGKWDGLMDNLVYAKDVRQVLTYVETGNAGFGFVYESDALSSNKVRIIATVESDTHKPIIYPGALLKNTTSQDAAREFLTFLQSREGQLIFEKYGFSHEGDAISEK